MSNIKRFVDFINENSDLADWQERWDELMMDMEEEAEPEGGDVADEYSRRMQELEAEKENILSRSKRSSVNPDEEEFEANKKKFDYLRQHLNGNQAQNVINWVKSGRNKDFIKIRLEFYGVAPEEIKKMLDILFETDYLGINRLVSQYGDDSFESIKRFAQFSKIYERSNIEELLANPENMWIVYVGNEPVGGMEYLYDAFNDVLLTRVADTEEEEYEFQDRVDDILNEIGSDYDEVDQDELDDAIDTMMNEMGKTPIYRIKKRNNIG